MSKMTIIVGVACLVLGLVAGIFIGRFLAERGWSQPKVLERLSAAEVQRSSGKDANPVPAAGSDQPAAAAPDAPKADEQKPADAPDAQARDEQAWRDRMAKARADLEHSEMYLDALQSKINALWADFTSRDDPAQRAVIESDRKKALAEFDRVKQQVQQ